MVQKHGHARRNNHTPTYKVWAGMIKRCRCEGCDAYKYYGGVGVKVCKTWLSYRNFLRDMGEKPEGMTIDRINSKGNYSKRNCRWADKKTQIKNRKNTIMISAFGKKMSISEWSEETGLTHDTIYLRLRRGLSNEDAVGQKRMRHW